MATTPLPKVKTFILPLLSAIALSAVISVENLYGLIWLAFIPFLYFLSSGNLSKKEVFMWSLAIGTLYGLSSLYPLMSLDSWWWRSSGGLFWEYRQALWTGLILLMSVVAFGGSFAVFGIAYRTFKRNNVLDIILFPLLWVVLEALREILVIGYGWGEFGYLTHNFSQTFQLAKTVGIPGLSFLVVAVNMLIFTSIDTLVNRPRKSLPAVFALVLMGGFLYNPAYLFNKPPAQKQDMPVAIIHVSTTTDDGYDLNTYYKYLELVENAVSLQPRLVVLPENAIPFFVIDEDTKLPLGYENPNLDIKDLYQKLLDISVQKPETAFVLGLHTRKGDANFNSAVVLQKGAVSNIYRKRRLLPLAEKNPAFLEPYHKEPLTEGEASEDGFGIGDDYFSFLICSEAYSSKIFKNNNQARALINIGNETFLGKDISFAKQSLIMAKARAVENNTYVIRSVKGGYSGIIDPYGRVLQITSPDTNDVLFGSI